MDIKVAIKTGVVAALAWFIGDWLSQMGGRPPSLLSGIWCVVAAIVVVQEHIGGAYKVAFSRFSGIAIGSIFGSLLTHLLGATPLSLGIAVTITVAVCSAFLLKDSYRIASLSVAIVMVSWQFKPEVDPWRISLYRFIDSSVGIIVALAIVHLLWPTQATQVMRKNIAKTLNQLNKLYRLSIFSYVQNEGQQGNLRPLKEEIEDLLVQNLAFFEEAKMELITKTSSLAAWGFLLEHLQGLLDSILSLQNVYNKDIYNFFDQELITQLQDLVRQTERAFHRLSNMLMNLEQAGEVVDLNESLEKLKQELIRFRSVRPTRQLPWLDAQNFFVFFYSLKTIAEELRRMEKGIESLNGS
jgi:uncharacterized membrane protein YccC